MSHALGYNNFIGSGLL